MQIIKKENTFINTETGEIIIPKYNDYDYINGGIIPIEPMTAKEEDREEELERLLEPNNGYYVEEKFDGTRATLHFYPDCRGTRVFSRRISVKTDWYSENTDSLPQLRDLKLDGMETTILDGEMFIPNRPFKDVSSTLNCIWDKAIDRQLELGYIVLHTFDIIYYNGIYVAKLPLWRRKQLLQKVVDKLDSPYVKMVDYSEDNLVVHFDNDILKLYNKGIINKEQELEKKIERLQKKNDTYKEKQGVLLKSIFGENADQKSLSELNPDEIKVKLDQIMEIKDEKNT